MTIQRPSGYSLTDFADAARYVAQMTGASISKLTGFEVQFVGSRRNLRHIQLLMKLAL